MQQPQSSFEGQNHGGPKALSPLDHEGLCLLSLDGGGVRGLSTLYVLRGIMMRLNEERKAQGHRPVKPCEVFDIIAGTSTGGLIAIMLGRLEMDMDECISKYCELMSAIFRKKLQQLPINSRMKIKSQFDSATLKEAIKNVIVAGKIPETELFNNKTKRGCKVLVCATAYETKSIVRFRDYSLPGYTDTSATIIEVALATAAATLFFDPVVIGARKYVDGALGANNPVDEVEREASDIWCSETGDLKPLVKCFISIGTGDPGKAAIEDNIIKFLSKTLVDISTETGRTAERSIARWRGHYDEKRYFRFNVQQGLQRVGAAEYQEQGTIEAATDDYMNEQEQRFRVRDCVANLKLKQRKTRIDFLRVANESILKIAVSQPITLRKACWSVPFQRNQRFVGRSDLLANLKTKLTVEDFCSKVAIIGLGGVGKTQIALELAYQTKYESPDFSIFWVPAISPETVQQAYREMGRQLQIPGIEDDSTDTMKLVKEHMSQESAGQWLLIVDNADDIDMWFERPDDSTTRLRLIDYLPLSSQGSIVLTTRNRKAAVKMAQNNVIEVSKMEEHAAEEILRKALINPEILNDHEATRKVLEQLTFLPLAIVQAAAYINENGLSLSGYSRLLDQEEEGIIEILSEDFEDEGRYGAAKNPIATTWLISFQKIRDRDTLAAEYLSFMACIEPKNIPRSLLPPAISKNEATKAIGTLTAYSFITTRDPDAADQIFDLHRLVHLATRNWLRQGGTLPEQAKDTLARLAEVMPYGDHENRHLWRTYFPHVRYVLACDLIPEQTEDRLDLLENYAQCLHEDGRYAEAQVPLTEVVDARQRLLGEEHLDTLKTMGSLAVTYLEQGKWKEAEELGRRVLEVRQRLLGEEHPDTLLSIGNLARIYSEQGKWKEFEELWRWVLEAWQRLLGEEHPDTLITMGNLAVTYSEPGKWKEAEELGRRVLEAQQRLLGEEHLDTLLSIGNLVRIYSEQGKWKEVEELWRWVLEARQRLLGEEHPDTLTTMGNLARTYSEQGKWKEVEELWRWVLEARQRLLGEEHPDTLLSMNNLAVTWKGLGRNEEAIALMAKCVHGRQRVLGKDHHYSKKSLSRLEHWEAERNSEEQAESDCGEQMEQDSEEEAAQDSEAEAE